MTKPQKEETVKVTRTENQNIADWKTTISWTIENKIDTQCWRSGGSTKIGSMAGGEKVCRWVARGRQQEPGWHDGQMAEQCCVNHKVVDGASRCLQPLYLGSSVGRGWIVVVGSGKWMVCGCRLQKGGGLWFCVANDR